MSVNLTAMKADTTQILTDLGQSIGITANTPTFGNDGMPTDSWGTATTETGDIQPVSGATIQAELGLKFKSTHEIFLKFDTVAAAGKRIRPAGWVTGADEYVINYVNVFDDHAVAYCTMVKGHK